MKYQYNSLPPSRLTPCHLPRQREVLAVAIRKINSNLVHTQGLKIGGHTYGKPGGSPFSAPLFFIFIAEKRYL